MIGVEDGVCIIAIDGFESVSIRRQAWMYSMYQYIPLHNE
jgi:hypothetical protein